MEQVRNYAAATEADFRGFRPLSNKMCVAKSSDDGQWYRAACLAQEEDTFVLFFADFGFVEEVNRNTRQHYPFQSDGHRQACVDKLYNLMLIIFFSRLPPPTSCQWILP